MPAVPYPSGLLEVQTIDEISEQAFRTVSVLSVVARVRRTSLNDELKDLQTWLKHILTIDGARTQLAGGLGECQW
jgi:hypothetical protein